MSEQQPVNEVGPKNVQHFFAFAAVVIVLVGQILIYTTPVDTSVLFPPAVWVGVFGLALFVWSRRSPPPAFAQTFLVRLQLSRPILWTASSLVLSLLAVLTMILFEQQQRTNYIPVLTFWFLAAICYVAGQVRKFPSLSFYNLREWLYSHRLELGSLGLIVTLAAALRFYSLGQIPHVINGDEARVGVSALNYLRENPFSMWENFGGVYTQAIGVALRVFEISPFSLRLAAAVGGTLAIPALYLLARQIAGWRIALIAAGLLAVSHTHIHFSRTIAVAYIQGTWLIPLELYFLLSGLMKRSSWRSAIGGVLLAMHFTVYLDAQIITALILAYMAIAFIFLRPWFKPALNQALAFWGGFGIVFLPELVYILNHPDIFFDRLSQDGTFQTGRLAQMMTDTGQNTFQILGGRVVHAFLSLIYYPSIDFYGSNIPMLSLISATLFMLGLVVVLWEVNSPGFLLLNGYFWAGTLSVGLFALPVSADTYRMLVVLPAAFLMAAIGLDRALQAVGAGWVQNRKTYTATTALVLASLLIFNIWAYYFNFVGRCLYSDDDSGQTRFASYLGNYARTIDRENATYLLSDDTFFYGSHDSVDFLSNRLPMINVLEPVDTLQVRPNQVVIASPNRVKELRAWADTYPGGELHYKYDCQDTVLLAYQFQ